MFFLENLLTPWNLQGDKLVSGLKPTTKLQVIADDDIGKFGAKAFIEADTHRNAEVDIAVDSITFVEAADALSERYGRKITYEQTPIEEVRKKSGDLALMFEWFERVGYSADIASLEKTWGARPLTLREWVGTQKQT